MFNLSAPTVLSRMITLIIALTIHEFAHAWTADRFGDTTPRAHGRLTLNPIAHLDLMGTMMLLLAGFGWAKPVPVNPYALNRHSSSAYMWVSAAGPLSNLLLAVLAVIPIRLGFLTFQVSTGFFPTIFEFLYHFISINLLLFFFNLIPLAPLDGEKVAQYLFPPPLKDVLDKIRPYGPMILLAVLFLGPYIGIDLLGRVIYPLMSSFMKLLLGVPL